MDVSLREYLEARMATLETMLTGIDRKLDAKVDSNQFAKLEMRVDELVRVGSQHAQNAERIALETKVELERVDLRVSTLHDDSIRRAAEAREERNGIAARLDEKYKVRVLVTGALSGLATLGMFALAAIAAFRGF